MLEATLEGERAGREREREEFKARSLGTCLSNSGLESDRPGAPSGSSPKPPPFASPRAVAAPSPVKVPPERTGSLDGGANRFEFSDGIAPNPEPSDVASGDTYRRILAEQRGERKVVRLEAELAKLRTHNEALRRQMRATQEASFEDVAVVPPSDPAEADAMRRAEDEAHRWARRAPPTTPPRSSRRSTRCESRRRDRRTATADGDGGGDIVAGAIAAAADAEAAAWRRATAAAVQQRKIARAFEADANSWRAALEDERAASRDAGRAWRKIKSDLETARDEAVELPPRARVYRRPRFLGRGGDGTGEGGGEGGAAGGGGSLAARDAATGASAGGAPRGARDEAAKAASGSRVGLIGCHRSRAG